MPIHPTAIVSSKAKLPLTVDIGAYCVVGQGVVLGEGCVLMNHVSLQGPSVFGRNNLFHPFCSVGGRTQDLKYKGEPTHLEVGDDNEFREFVSVNRGTAPGEKTVIGSHNLFLTYSHVAHNCVIGSHCILSNNGTLGGHVIMEDHAIVSGLAAVHQFCRIGAHALIGGCTKIVQDVPPFFIADGNPAEVRAVNEVGLKRRGFTDENVKVLRRALKILYNLKLNTTQALTALEQELGQHTEVQSILKFVRESERGIIR